MPKELAEYLAQIRATIKQSREFLEKASAELERMERVWQEGLEDAENKEK